MAFQEKKTDRIIVRDFDSLCVMLDLLETIYLGIYYTIEKDNDGEDFWTFHLSEEIPVDFFETDDDPDGGFY